MPTRGGGFEPLAAATDGCFPMERGWLDGRDEIFNFLLKWMSHPLGNVPWAVAWGPQKALGRWRLNQHEGGSFTG